MAEINHLRDRREMVIVDTPYWVLMATDQAIIAGEVLTGIKITSKETAIARTILTRH